jgi:hypothetical protein
MALGARVVIEETTGTDISGNGHAITGNADTVDDSGTGGVMLLVGDKGGIAATPLTDVR